MKQVNWSNLALWKGKITITNLETETPTDINILPWKCYPLIKYQVWKEILTIFIHAKKKAPITHWKRCVGHLITLKT